jgi:ABC-type multidrug transport system fused ATPase/permease subunit
MILRQLEKLFSRIKKVFELILLSKVGYVESGRRSVYWLVAGVSAMLALVIVEGLFVKQIQKILGMLHAGSTVNVKVSFLSWMDSFGPLASVLFLLLVVTIRGFLNFINGLAPQVIEKMFYSRMRKKLLYFFLHHQEGSVLSSAEITHYLAELLPKASVFLSRQASVLGSLIFIVVTTFYLFYLSWFKMLIAFFGFIVIFICLNFFSKMTRGAAAQQLLYNNYIFKHLDRIANNFFMIRTMRTSQAEYRQLVGLSVYQGTNFLRANLFGVVTGNLAVTMGGVLLCLLISVELFTSFKTGENFLIFLYMLIRLVQRVGELSSSLGFMNAEYPNFYATVTFFPKNEKETESSKLYMKYVNVWKDSRKPRRVHVFHSLDEDKVSMRAAPVLDFTNVSFSYSQDVSIFNGLNLEIKSGEFFGIVGKSGSGKSTLLALLLGLIKPQKGKVLIDGILAEEFYNHNHFPLAYAGPDPYVFPGTLKEILDYGRWRTYTEADYEDAMFKAKFLPVFKSLGSDLSWEYNEHDNALSTGEKQRLSLTRAFLLKPKLLILDEVTSNLDTATENDVLESLKLLKGQCTTIMISHRKNSLRDADRIYDVAKKEFVKWDDILS